MERKGIDISHWQGNIDWQAVKASGVEFAIIKAGGSDDGFYTDSNFETNYSNAKAVGMPIGAYYFVGKDFKSKEDGIADAKRFVDIIKDKSFEYPIYVDVEITRPEEKEGVTEATIEFCKYLQDKKYLYGIYGSDIGTFETRVNLNELDGIEIWVARYGGEPKYVPCYGMWQYSSSGQVLGIKGNVDMNLCYKDYPTIIKNGGFNNIAVAEEIEKVEVSQYKHNVGDYVTFNAIFATSLDNVELNPLYPGGKITSIKDGARNPYLINEGMGWVNDDVITEENTEKAYTVKQGDSLWTIAVRELGNGNRYIDIANRNNIANVNKIYPGQVLIIPK